MFKLLHDDDFPIEIFTEKTSKEQGHPPFSLPPLPVYCLVNILIFDALLAVVRLHPDPTLGL